MSLRLLLDEQISPQVATQACFQVPEIPIQSVRHWRGGEFLGKADELLLAAATVDELTLVTYDLRTIPSLLGSLAAQGQSHAGVVLIDYRTIPPRDIGRLVAAIIVLWRQAGSWEWKDRVVFLAPPS